MVYPTQKEKEIMNNDIQKSISFRDKGLIALKKNDFKRASLMFNLSARCLDNLADVTNDIESRRKS